MRNKFKKEVPFDLDIKMKIIKEFGFELGPRSVILDFGCGNGKMVKELCDLGYNAFGCCTRYTHDGTVRTEEMIQQGIIRELDMENYALPFEDNTFDFIYSHSVFEHVQNYSQSISEIARVLKPDGYCLHFFPSRYRPVEVHVFVPFSSVIRSKLWLYLWVLMGIRNEWTTGLKPRETVIRFYNYLKEETNYRTRKQLKSDFGLKFNDVIFCENFLNKYSPNRGKYLYALSRYFSFIPVLYSAIYSRAIFTRSPKKAL